MKIFIIFGAHSKIRVLGGEVHEKPIYRGDCLKRGGLVQFEDLRREGGDNPTHTMNMNPCESTGNTIVAETSNNDSVGHDENVSSDNAVILLTETQQLRLNQFGWKT